MRAVIFANGSLKPGAEKLLKPDDVVLAADGGARHCLALSIIPAVVIGDFDSLTDWELERLARAGAEIIRHPAQKDQTDLELALEEALVRGADEILILGALGGRWDMSAANLLLPARPDLVDRRVVLIDGDQEIFIARPGRKYDFQARPGDSFSLIPLTESASGVTLSGFQYPLSDATLTLGQARGVSNVFLKPQAELTFKSGRLLCVVARMGPDHEI